MLVAVKYETSCVCVLQVCLKAYMKTQGTIIVGVVYMEVERGLSH